MQPFHIDEVTVRRRRGRAQGGFTLLELLIVVLVLLMIGLLAVRAMRADTVDLHGPAGGQIDPEVDVALIQTAASEVEDGVQSVTLDTAPTPGNLLVVVGGSRAAAPYPAPPPSGQGWREVQVLSTAERGGNKTIGVWTKQALDDEAVTISWDAGRHGALVVREFSVGMLSSASIATEVTLDAPLELGPAAGVRGPGLVIAVAMVRGETTVSWTGTGDVEEVIGGSDQGLITLSTGSRFVQDASVHQVPEADGWVSGEGGVGAGGAGVVVILQP